MDVVTKAVSVNNVESVTNGAGKTGGCCGKEEVDNKKRQKPSTFYGHSAILRVSFVVVYKHLLLIGRFGKGVDPRPHFADIFVYKEADTAVRKG